jgi:glycosyltransferase involved in cell wall biosynthesis
MAMALSEKNFPKIAICHGTGIEFAINNQFHQRNVNHIIQASSRIIFPTRSMYEVSERIFPVLKKMRCDVVPWGIPSGAFRKIKKKDFKSKKSIRLLYAGRLTENKSVDTIINALSLLELEISLTIIGSGDQYDNLTDLTEKLCLEGRIEFIPFVKRDELWKILTEYDICIISTKIVEAFCLMAIEAQAHGLVIVYSDTGGPKDIIGNTGIMYKTGDFVDMARKIQYLVSHRDELSKFSLLGIENSKKYKIENLREQLFDLSKSEIIRFDQQNNE